MNELMTKDEVISLAFQRPITTTKIQDGLIQSVQILHIRPVLGLDLYTLVIAAPTTTYAALVAMLKPALANFVKFYILPEIYNDISNSGINKIPGINRAPGAVEDLGSARQIALDQANLNMNLVSDFLKANATVTIYKNYIWQEDPNNQIQIAGGIISRIDVSLSEE